MKKTLFRSTSEQRKNRGTSGLLAVRPPAYHDAENEV